MKNHFTVHFKLAQSQILDVSELEILEAFLGKFEPNHKGNKSRGIGDIHDLNFVLQEVEDGEEEITEEEKAIVDKLTLQGIYHIEI